MNGGQVTVIIFTDKVRTKLVCVLFGVLSSPCLSPSCQTPLLSVSPSNINAITFFVRRLTIAFSLSLSLSSYFPNSLASYPLCSFNPEAGRSRIC